MRRAKRDVMRKERCARQIGMAVHGVDPEQDRNARAAAARCGAEFTHQPCPFGRIGTFITVRPGIAPGEDRAERILGQIRRGDCADIGLDHLADFLFERHLGQQRIDPRFGGRIGQRGGALGLGPQRCMGQSRVALLRGIARQCDSGCAADNQGYRRKRRI